MYARYIRVTLFVAFALSLCAVAGAADQIDQLQLSHQGTFTVLTIHRTGDAPVRFSQQLVEAKDGKPYRIVVDVLHARHGLAQKEFDRLPASVITAVRTSQYRVDPEEVVRIVLDLKNEAVYRVEAQGSSVKIMVTDPDAASFTTWSSGKAATKSAAAIPHHTEGGQGTQEMATKKPEVTAQPRIPSELAQKQNSNQAQATTKAMAKKPASKATAGQGLALGHDPKPTQVVKDASTYGPQLPPRGQTPAMASVDNGQVPPPGGSPSTTGTGSNAVHKSDVVPDKNMTPSVESSKPKVVQPEQKAKPGEKEESTADDTKPAQKKMVPSSVKQDKKGTLASKPTPKSGIKQTEPEKLPDDKEQADKEKESPTRFLRSSAKTAKLKSTQVVQFPQRLVIKYGASVTRDPFKTLIDETKSTAGALEHGIPNVEALELVGILESTSGKNLALLEDREGIGYILRPGDRVRRGYVIDVDKQAVYFRIEEYGWGRTVTKHMEKEN